MEALKAVVGLFSGPEHGAGKEIYAVEQPSSRSRSSPTRNDTGLSASTQPVARKRPHEMSPEEQRQLYEELPHRQEPRDAVPIRMPSEHREIRLPVASQNIKKLMRPRGNLATGKMPQNNIASTRLGSHRNDRSDARLPTQTSTGHNVRRYAQNLGFPDQDQDFMSTGQSSAKKLKQYRKASPRPQREIATPVDLTVGSDGRGTPRSSRTERRDSIESRHNRSQPSTFKQNRTRGGLVSGSEEYRNVEMRLGVKKKRKRNDITTGPSSTRFGPYVNSKHDEHLDKHQCRNTSATVNEEANDSHGEDVTDMLYQALAPKDEAHDRRLHRNTNTASSIRKSAFAGDDELQAAKRQRTITKPASRRTDIDDYVDELQREDNVTSVYWPKQSKDPRSKAPGVQLGNPFQVHEDPFDGGTRNEDLQAISQLGSTNGQSQPRRQGHRSANKGDRKRGEEELTLTYFSCEGFPAPPHEYPYELTWNRIDKAFNVQEVVDGVRRRPNIRLIHPDDVQQVFIAEDGNEMRLQGPVTQDVRFRCDLNFDFQTGRIRFHELLLDNCNSQPKEIKKSSEQMQKMFQNELKDRNGRLNTSISRATDDDELGLLQTRVANGSRSESRSETTQKGRRASGQKATLELPEKLPWATEQPKRASRRLKEKSPVLMLERSPSPPRYSETVGLGPRWKVPVTFPFPGRAKVNVDFDDLLCLDEREYLNDNVIDFYMNYALSKALGSGNVKADTVHIFNTFFYLTLTKRGGSKSIDYPAVERWTAREKVDIFKYDFVVVPIIEEFHWYLAIICNLPRVRRACGDADETAEASAMSQAHAISEVQQSKPESEDQDIVTPPERVTPESLASLRHQAANLHINGKLEEVDEEWPNDSENPVRKSVSPFKGAGPSGEAEPSTEQNKASHSQESSGGALLSALPASPLSKKRKGRKPGRSLPKYDPHEPIVIILDSLGVSHTNTVRNLKKYLTLEAKAKRGMTVNIEKGMNATGLPQQGNVYDCGVYVLGYFEAFLNDPREFTRKILQREMDPDMDWPQLDPTKIRNSLRNILQDTYRQQAAYREQKNKERHAASSAVKPVDSAATQEENENGKKSQPSINKPHEDDQLADRNSPSPPSAVVDSIEHELGQAPGEEDSTSQSASNSAIDPPRARAILPHADTSSVVRHAPELTHQRNSPVVMISPAGQERKHHDAEAAARVTAVDHVESDHENLFDKATEASAIEVQPSYVPSRLDANFRLSFSDDTEIPDSRPGTPEPELGPEADPELRSLRAAYAESTPERSPEPSALDKLLMAPPGQPVKKLSQPPKQPPTQPSRQKLVGKQRPLQHGPQMGSDAAQPIELDDD